MTCNTRPISLVSRLIWKHFRWKLIDIFENVCSLHTCFSADSFHLLSCITPCESSGRFFGPPGRRNAKNQLKCLVIKMLVSVISEPMCVCAIPANLNLFAVFLLISKCIHILAHSVNCILFICSSFLLIFQCMVLFSIYSTTATQLLCKIHWIMC